MAEAARVRVAEERKQLESVRTATQTKSPASASTCHVTVNRPSFTLIAGANGSGKSTLTNSNPDIFASFPILDPDAIARTIQSTVTASSAITAGRQALQIAKQLLHDQKSFAVETTLSGKNYLQMMLDARNWDLKLCSSISAQRRSRSTWPVSPTVCWWEVTTFQKQMSGGGMRGV